ncbi:MAG: hypothetical protein HQ582_09180 [Planctomycetes bacterium]|nr:hypothetical protein [Planctomycetota bacterium]
MRITIHKDHGLTIDDVGDTPVDVFMHDSGSVSVSINPSDEDDDDGGDQEPDPCWSDSMLGRN